MIWRLKGLRPGYRTIGSFRRDNRAALAAANREFVLLARRLDLIGGELVAIDGAYFHGDAGKASIVNDGNDTDQLRAMAQAAQQAVGGATLTVVADVRPLQRRDPESLRG